MLGDGMSASQEYRITSEEVPRGPIPAWLMEHMQRQSLDSTPFEQGGPPRIITVYPNENSRRQALSNLETNAAIDGTLHHTMDSLISSLVADLRLPRVIPKDGPFELILHEACREEAAKLSFPLINPLPEMKWGRGKTAALSELNSYLSSEHSLIEWDGPGAGTYNKILRDLERKLGGTHPDLAISRVISRLRLPEEPFTISDVDGIIILNQSPGLHRSHSELLLSISRICPVHQLCYPGNFRLGHHGFMLLDQYPISASSQLPDWIPPHPIESKSVPTKVSRFLLQREAHSFDVAIDLVRTRLEANLEDCVLIVDPALGKNRNRWERALRGIGIEIAKPNLTALSHPLGHWLRFLASLPHGSDAFSLESLCAISLQSTIPVFENPGPHPSEETISPTADLELLTNIARDNHILGGPGALSKWMGALSRAPMEESDSKSKESTQWWLLCLASSLRPILCSSDCKALDESNLSMGCQTGEELPSPTPTYSGDEWLIGTLRGIDLESLMGKSHGDGPSVAGALQSIVENHQNLREMQRSAGYSQPDKGPDWVDEFSSIIRTTTVRSGGSTSRGRVTVSTPKEALGCTADLTIMANLSSSSWVLKVPKVPFLAEEERHSLNLLRPDGPIRDARHHLMHLLSSSEEVVVLDPSIDDSSPAAAPIREWASTNVIEDDAEEFPKHGQKPVSPRDLRQLDGQLIRIGKPPYRRPINPSSVSICFDSLMQEERAMRQPFRASDDGYLDEDATAHIVSIDKDDLFRVVPRGFTHPRENDRWPVIGGMTSLAGRKTPTIDPRPLMPGPTGSEVSDSRHGHAHEPPQSIGIWSPTRIHDWLRCPRMGWLSRGVRANKQDSQDEDLDGRTQGTLLHNVHHDILSKVLDLGVGEERQFTDQSIRNVPSSAFEDNELMRIALEALDTRAPWLDRADAVSNHRLRVFTGMERERWNSWLSEPTPVPPSGRIGAIVMAEREICSSPISLEWSIGEHIPGGARISLPEELTGGEQLPPINVHGFIDRVDLLPFDENQEIWFDEDVHMSVAPIRIIGTGWRPRRLVAIRDLKTTESKSPEERHKSGLLEELQLALYARSWELAHPGDLVVGAGISVIGHKCKHFIETSSLYPISKPIGIGQISSHTAALHRFIDEGPSPIGDHFRAWLAQRLSVALRVAEKAAIGRVHPTPSKHVCRFCPVSSTCQVREEGDY